MSGYLRACCKALGQALSLIYCGEAVETGDTIAVSEWTSCRNAGLRSRGLAMKVCCGVAFLLK